MFTDRGFRVLATARKAASLSDLAAKGIETLSLVVDDPASVRKCYKEVEGLLEGKGLDYLYHNAGQSESIVSILLTALSSKPVFRLP